MVEINRGGVSRFYATARSEVIDERKLHIPVPCV